MRLTDADALYERATALEAQAFDYVGKLIERDGDEPSVEWRVWSAILAERTAFKHDLMDAPTIDRPQGEWIKHIDDLFPCESTQECSICHAEQFINGNDDNYCPNCGARMKGANDEF